MLRLPETITNPFKRVDAVSRCILPSIKDTLCPRNRIHVAHIIIDGAIDTPAVRERYHPAPGEPLLHPDAIAEAYWTLAGQPKSAWTFEIDLRPFNEDFFV